MSDDLSSDVPLVRCAFCGGWVTEGSTCPKGIECPQCGAKPGASCRRPSGHRASSVHVDRWKTAERLDRESGIPPRAPV